MVLLVLFVLFNASKCKFFRTDFSIIIPSKFIKTTS